MSDRRQDHDGGVPQLTREQLELRLAGGRIALVNALAPSTFVQGHIPGSLNLPPDRVRHDAPRLLPDRDQEVVVYCGSFT